MARRSRAREVVLQLLYQYDYQPDINNAQVVHFLRERLQHEDVIEFAKILYQGTIHHRAEIDQQLSLLAENWSISRMPTVDRNILRLGAFELLHLKETPVKVILDEAVELAKRYGTSESASFVNGILDRLAHGNRKRTDKEDFK